MKIIGISYSGDHDSSCAIVIDGELKFAISEERLTRKKHDSSFPINSIKKGLEFTNLKPEDIDFVCISWSNPLKQLIFDFKLLFKNKFSFKGLLYTSYSNFYKLWIKGGFKRYEDYFGKSKFLFCDHHLAHAISAYSYSPFNEAVIVVIDGRGAYEATSIWYAKDGKIEPVEIINFPNSIGLFYAKFTKYLGFKPLSDEWKVMGLAPYGEDGISLKEFIENECIPYKVKWKRLLRKGLYDVSGIEEIFGPQRKEDEEISQKHKDIAFACQRETEKAILNIVKYAIEKTKCKNLCLAGGVILNCKANGIVANSGIVDDIFIQPAASDEGAALGAALYPYLIFEKRLPKFLMENLYLGPSYKEEEIEKILKNCKLKYERLINPSKVVAELIYDGKIIGIFQGRMEFGPRALGNRSILADPRHSSMKDKVNNSVKYREWWRPFAPTILEDKYFEFFDTKFLSPFMILSFPVKKEMREKIPATVHVDGTARPQSLNKKINPFYYEIISEFYKKTGVPALLNTSFNLKNEPIVCSPLDAIRTFYTSGLDYLILENFLVSK